MKLLDLTIPYEPLDKESLYDDISKEYRFLADNSLKMRLLIATDLSDKKLPGGFAQTLVDIVPALNYQLCTNHKHQSFADHITEEQSDLPHVLEHVIIGLMMMIKNDNYHGVTMGSKRLAEIIVTYRNKEVSVELAYLAIRLINALLAGEKVDLIEEVKKINNGRVLVWRKNVKNYKYAQEKSPG